MDNFTGRPNRSDPALRKMANTDLAKQLAAEWPEGRLDEERWEELIERAGVFTYGRFKNGYELARELEHVGAIKPDAQLVELLDCASQLDDVVEEAVRQWVKFHDLKLSRAIGDKVSAPNDCSGVITRLESDVARYIVTPEGDPRFAQGGGFLVDAEKCSDPEMAETA